MNDWQDLKLGDVLTLQRGFDITRANQLPGAIPVVSSSGIGSYHSEAMVEGPGVVIGRKGSLGTCFFLNQAFWPHDTTLWVKDFKGNDPHFCYFLLKSMDLAKFDVGAANPTLNRNHIHILDVRCPSISTQRRIASILGAYDDLIEVNRQRIALLEEMARRLFEEWFVRFRFPGHEGHAIDETPQGLLPAGWEALKIGDAFEIVGGGTPSKAEARYWDGGTINWYTPSDLTGSKTAFMNVSSSQITEEGLRRSSAQLFPAFSVMMTSRATLGVISINTTEASTNQGFITCIPNDRVPLCFLAHWVRANVPTFVAHATGSTFKEITKGVFRQLTIVLPPAELVSMFERRVRPIIDMVLTLERTQHFLATSRDLLLPRLISGDLSAIRAEVELEAVA